MFSHKKSWAIAAVLFVNLNAIGLVQASSNGIDDPASAAKLMRAGAKANQMMKNSDGSDGSGTTSSNGTTGCNGVNVGNVYTDKKGNNPKEVITVIKGDIINTGKCKK